MCLFKYREKKFGKLALILLALLFIAAAAGAVFGGVYAVIHMTHWAKYVIVSVAGVFAFLTAGIGLYMILISFSMINTWRSVRDVNTTGKVKDVRLCDKCGRVISKHADFCEHCGEAQESGTGLKKCEHCGTKNSAAAKFCENCGKEF